jgi:HEAT repeat protein
MRLALLRRALLTVLLVPCLGFEWPGQVYRIAHGLEHADPEQRRQLVRELGQYGAASVKEPLLAALEDADSGVRLEAASVAGRVRLREAVPILLDWLDDKEAETRRSAAAALGRIGEARALAAIARALGDAAAEVRRAAVIALGQLGSADAVVPLLGRLEDVDLGVRTEAIGALGTMRDARAVAPLLGALADPAAEVRTAVSVALGRIGDARALPALAHALGDEVDDVRLAAAAALGQLGDPGAVRALKPVLERADARLGQAVIAALAAIDDDGARALLITELTVPTLRLAATRALVQQAQRARRRAPPSTPSTTVGAATTPTPSDTLVATLADALRAADPSGKLAIARALTQLAEVAPIDAALDALLASVPGADADLSAALIGALGASGAPQALMPLLERLGQPGDVALQQAALDALRAYFGRAEPDGRAADPLLTLLSSAAGAQRLEVVELLGRVGAARALPALAPLLQQRDPALRIAVASAIGAIGAPEGAVLLLPLLDAEDARTRLQAASALRGTADIQVVEALLTKLDAEQTADRHAVLVALGGALRRLSLGGSLPKQLGQRCLQSIATLAGSDDDELSDRALDALSVWSPPGALALVAPGLRSPSSRRRASVATLLGQLDDPQARPVLRYLLQHGSSRETASAAAALAELGDQRDVPALIKATKRSHWPVPGAAAYALQRMAVRGTLKRHLAARELCELGRSREPYVRANVAAALATLAAAACEHEGPDPIEWLQPQHGAIVRAAAARWAAAAAAAGHLDAAKASAALERCAATDIEPSVRAVCAQPDRRAQTEATEVYAHAADGTTLLRDSLVALRLADDSVYLGYTDRNGHVRLKAAPRGELRLEDPSLVPLEPPEQQAPPAEPPTTKTEKE